MKTFLLDDILLIGEVPNRLSNPETQALFEQIDEWFRGAAATAVPPRPERGIRAAEPASITEKNMTPQTTKDS